MVLKQAPLSMQVATPQAGHSRSDGDVGLWLYEAQSGESHPKPTQVLAHRALRSVVMVAQEASPP